MSANEQEGASKKEELSSKRHTADIKKQAPSGKGPLSFLYQPEEDINYNFILSAYVVCSLICGALFAADQLKIVDAIKGYWIVFSPFVLMTPWALFMRQRAQKMISKEKKE